MCLESETSTGLSADWPLESSSPQAEKDSTPWICGPGKALWAPGWNTITTNEEAWWWQDFIQKLHNYQLWLSFFSHLITTKPALLHRFGGFRSCRYPGSLLRFNKSHFALITMHYSFYRADALQSCCWCWPLYLFPLMKELCFSGSIKEQIWKPFGRFIEATVS